MRLHSPSTARLRVIWQKGHPAGRERAPHWDPSCTRFLSASFGELHGPCTIAPWRGAPNCTSRAQGRGRGRRARARAGGARRAGGAARCSHDGRGCVRSGQSRGRLRPLHPGATATYHPARRVLGKDTARRAGARGSGNWRDLTRPGRPCRPKRFLAPATELLSPIAETSRLSLPSI